MSSVSSVSSSRFVPSPRLVAALVVGIGVILAVAGVNLYLQRSISETTRQELDTQFEQLSVNIANNLDASLSRFFENAEIMSHDGVFHDLDAKDQFSEAVKGIPEDADPELRAGLIRVNRLLDGFAAVIHDEDGILYALEPFRIQRILKSADISEREYFQHCAKTKKPVTTDFFMSNAGVPVMNHAIPLLDDDEFKGVFIVGIGLDQFAPMVAEQVVGTGTRAMILDRRGRVAARTGGLTLAQSKQINHELEGPNFAFINDLFNRTAATAFTGGNAETRTGKYQDPIDGELIRGTYYRLSSGWGLLVGKAEKDIAAVVDQRVIETLVWVSLVFIGIAIVPMILAFYLVGRWEKRLAANERRLTEQLLQAQKSETVGKLAGGIAHDFNNVLSVVIGSAEIAQLDAEEDSETSELLNQILEAGARAKTLTRQLLLFSRREQAQKTRVNLNSVLTVYQPLLHRLLPEQIELKVDIQAQDLVVLADRGQLEQILLNLVVNARDAIHGPGRITIRLAEAGDFIELSVIDDGQGIAQGIIDQIFEPFFTTKEVGRGTGIGLSTVRTIVEDHQGRISCHSEIGKGTEFKVALPKAPAEGAVTPIDSRQVDRSRIGALKILIAEDEPEILENLSRQLKGLGAEVHGFSDPRRLLEHVQMANQFDLLISDVIMPELTGGQLVTELHQIMKELPVVFTSGYTDDDLKRHGFNTDKYERIEKPYTLDEIIRAIIRVLDRTS